MSDAPGQALVVGRIVRPHGIRGEVSVEVRTDDPGLRFAVGSVLGTDPAAAGPLTVEGARWHTSHLLIRFAGIADRDRAEPLRGVWLTIDAADVPQPEDEDEFYDHQLVGLAVVTVAGEPVGTVTDVLHHGQDLLVIEPVARDRAGQDVVSVSGSCDASGAESPAETGSASESAAGTPAGAEPVGGHPSTGGSSGEPPGGADGPAVSRRAARTSRRMEMLVPFVAAIAVEVDLAAGKLVIDPPPGLLELSGEDRDHARPRPPARGRGRARNAGKPAGPQREVARREPGTARGAGPGRERAT